MLFLCRKFPQNKKREHLLLNALFPLSGFNLLFAFPHRLVAASVTTVVVAASAAAIVTAATATAAAHHAGYFG